MFISKLKNLSIHFKLTLLIISVSMIVLLLSSLTYYYNDFKYNHDKSKQNLLLVAELTAQNSLSALVFDDEKIAGEILSTLKSVKTIQAAFLYDAQGGLFAQYLYNPHNKSFAWSPEHVLRHEPAFASENSLRQHMDEASQSTTKTSNDFLHIFLPLINQRKNIGYIHLIDNQQDIKQHSRQLLIISSIIFLILLVLAAILSFFFARLISIPIVSLNSIVGQVEKNYDFSLRAVKQSDDEIGSLIDGFNSMLKEVEQRDEKLLSYNQELEKQVLVRTRQLRDKKELAEQANKSKSEFLANMSHEIRTPMNAIIGMTDVLSQSQLSSRQKKQVSLIINSSQNLMFILNDILDFSKIEAGKLLIEPVEVNLYQLIDETIDLFKLQADMKQLKLIKDINLSRTMLFTIDEVRIRQVLNNLLSNAIKFTHSGNVTLSCVTKLLDKRTDNNRAIIHIIVKDTGIGIADDKLKTIFASFEQAETGTTKNYGGTGLGLSISH